MNDYWQQLCVMYLLNFDVQVLGATRRPTTRWRKSERWVHMSRLKQGHEKFGRPTWYMEKQQCMEVKGETKSTKSGGKVMTSRVGSPCNGSVKYLKVSIHMSTPRRSHDGGQGKMAGLSLKTTILCFLFGPQNQGWTPCDRSSGMEGMWHHRVACVKAKWSREGGVSVQCLGKNLDQNAPAWSIILVVAIGVVQTLVRVINI